MLHLATDADTGEFVAAELMTHDVGDRNQVEGRGGPVASFTADGANDRDDVQAAVAVRSRRATLTLPPRSSAQDGTRPTQRDRRIGSIAAFGRMGWQRRSTYNWCAPVDAEVSRRKRVIGDALRFRADDRRSTEVASVVSALNRIPKLGRPESLRIA